MGSNFPEMVWDQGDVGERFKLFKSKMYLACEDNDIIDAKVIARKIKIGVGDEGLLKLETSGLTPEELDDPAELWRYFEDQFVEKVNFRMQRLVLMQMQQEDEESINAFVNRVRIQALKCEFKKDDVNERIIEVIIAGTTLETYRQELLKSDGNLTLDESVKIGHRHEGCMKATMKLNTESQPKNEDSARYIKTCLFCAGSHFAGKCPAYKVICIKCDRRGHYAHLCRTRRVNASHSASQKTDVNINMAQTTKPGPSMEDVLDKVVNKMAQPKVVHTVVNVTPGSEKQQGKKRGGGGGRKKKGDEEGGDGKDQKGRSQAHKQPPKGKKPGQGKEE